MSADESGATTLVTRLIAGDESALDQLVDLHWHALVAVAMVTTQSEDLAAEAAQDAFIRLWETRTRLDPNRSVNGVLFATVRYRALDLVKHERVHGRMAQRLAYESTHQAAVAYNAGEQAVDGAEFRTLVLAAIKALPPRCREIFLMNRKGKMSYADIAETLGVSIPTARNQMSLALQRIALAIAAWRKGE